MSADPFFLPPQSVVSFSGGRTSGYMLRRILDAHGGALPPDRAVVFCNTGKEREETLRFVERCSLEWGVPIRWLEYRWGPGRHYFAEVNYATASRNGEPFRMAIEARGFLPNPVMRFCTAELKIRTTHRFVTQWLGWGAYTNAIGLRADEQKRVLRMRQRREVKVEVDLFGDRRRASPRAAGHPRGESPVQPLYDAGVVLDDVAAFWRAQPFDLQLTQDEGNCDLCFLKGAAKLTKLIARRPESADWWAEAETLISRRDRSETARVRSDRPSYAELKQIATGDITAPGWLWADKGNAGACGEADECRCTD